MLWTGSEPWRTESHIRRPALSGAAIVGVVIDAVQRKR
jgi:hypothetical protein